MPSSPVCYFYPRPPRGGRQEEMLTCWKDTLFLSTPSARRATEVGTFELAIGKISIHALREEGDSLASGPQTRTKEFLSTPSARRATAAADQDRRLYAISIHALREEGDRVEYLHCAASL